MPQMMSSSIPMEVSGFPTQASESRTIMKVSGQFQSYPPASIDPDTGALKMVTDELNLPNGLCFSPDERKLYICENGVTPRKIHVYEVNSRGRSLRRGREFIDAGPGSIDGIRCDIEGRLWCGWGTGEGLDGVMVFDHGATPVMHIGLPERCANLCFGGLRRNRLFMAASRSLYAVYVNTQGVA